jgi:NAD(P)-dependent dehydrogenase (short-subunit alcohol dehydrogenase family)
MKSLDLKGKNIFVTGAAGFLGEHIVEELIECGATVYGVDCVKKDGVGFLDITNEESLDDYVADFVIFNEGQKIDGIVNNAAVSFKGDSLTSGQFTKTMEVNVVAVYNIIKSFKPVLSKSASVVNVASLYGINSPDFRIYDGDSSLYSSSAYGASKAALIQMTKYYAAELAPIRFNAVSPGGIYQGHSEEFDRRYSDRVPIKRMAQPEEITNPILFLLSPLSSYITGHNLVVDGGLTVW